MRSGHLVAVLAMGAALAPGFACSEEPRAGRAAATDAAAPTERVQARPAPPRDPETRLAPPDPPPLSEQCELEGLDARDRRASAGAERAADPEPTFSLKFRDEISPLSLISAFVMPGESLDLEAVLTPLDARFRARAEAGRLVRSGVARWTWHAPAEPGAFCIEVLEETTGTRICMRAFVMVPYDGSEVLRGYRIGRYEPTPLRGDPAYARPRGFVEVTASNRDTWLSPHFQLHQFLCKQPGDFPKYLVLTTRLLLKLETLLGEFRRRGIRADTFFVMSGYRTPFYNDSIGNRTRYSRHAYGDAADIFVDDDRDGVMDDLDRDGRVDAADARVLHQIVESLHEEPWYEPFVGGLGLYGPKPHRGPFIHVDTRGTRARW